MIKLLSNLFSGQTRAQARANQEANQRAYAELAFPEHPKVAELREKAKAKMKEWGRPSLLEGGEFSLNNTVLNNQNMVLMKGNKS
jgi:hypothetical protein